MSPRDVCNISFLESSKEEDCGAVTTIAMFNYQL